MSENKAPRITIGAIRSRLSVRYRNGSHIILLDDSPVGRLVSYGSAKGERSGNVSTRTVYASRIYQHGLTIEIEGSRPKTVLDKIASPIAQAVNTGKWPLALIPTPESVPSAPPPVEPAK